MDARVPPLRPALGRDQCPSCGFRSAALECTEHGPWTRLAEPLPPAIDVAIPGMLIEQRLGAGGFGTVFLARSLETNARAAVKVSLDAQDTATTLVREGELLARIGPPGVPQVIDRGRTARGLAYVAMTYVTGPTLAARMADRSRPTSPTILLGALRALELLHRGGLVHGDLKPENIILGGPLGATLVDLGLAEDIGATPASDSAVRPAGTAPYMAPEQCRSQVPVDVRTDVYAIGVLLYELLAGRPPFWGATESVQEAHRSHRPLPLPVTSTLNHLVMQCLAKDPAQRPASAGIVLAALEKLAREGDRGVPMGPTPRAANDSGVTRTTSIGRQGNPNLRQAVGILRFNLPVPLSVQRRIRGLEGQIVHVDGERCVVAFRGSPHTPPVRAAYVAARALLSERWVGQVLVDSTHARIRSRRNQPDRIMSPCFEVFDTHPRDTDPTGLLVTRAASEHLGELELRPGRRPGIFSVPTPLRERDARETQELQPIFGRERQLHQVLEAATESALGRPTLCTVSGERGAGKSCFATHVTETLRGLDHGPRVFSLRAPDPTAGAARRTLAKFLVQLLDLPARDGAATSGQLLADALGPAFVDEHGLGLELALDWVDRNDARLDKLKAAPGALHAAASIAAGEAIVRACRGRPTALVLDDAHFADEIFLAAIEYATRRERPLPLCVTVLVRTEFVRSKSRAAWGSGAGHHLSLDLGALDENGATQLVRHLLAPAANVPQWAVQRIIARTQGMPLLICELLEGLKRDGLLRRAERGSGYIFAADMLDDIPELPLADWLVTREINALPADLRELASVASVLGVDGSFAELDALVEELARIEGQGQPTLDTEIGMQRLMGAGIVQLERRTFRFRHELLVKRLLQDIPDAVRQTWHAAAYQALTRQAVSDRDGPRSRLALHAAEAGDAAVAFALHLELAGDALGRHAYVEAERNFAAASRYAPTEAGRLEALHGLGTTRCRLGLYEEATQALDLALDLARAHQDRQREVDLLLETATVWDWRDDWARSAELVERAEARISDDDHELTWARLCLGRGRTKFRRDGDLLGSSALLQEAAERARCVGEAGYETQVVSLLLAAALLAVAGNLESSEAAFEEVLELCRVHDDPLQLASAYNNRCALWSARKDAERCIADLQNVIAIVRRIGNPHLELMAMNNLAEIHLMASHYEEAARWSRAVADLADQVFGRGQTWLGAKVLLARISVLAGKLDAARAVIDELAPEHGAATEGMKPLDVVLYSAVQLFLESATEDRWDALLARCEQESLMHEAANLLELQGLAALRRGEPAVARRAWQAARDLLEQYPSLVETRLQARIEDQAAQEFAA